MSCQWHDRSRLPRWQDLHGASSPFPQSEGVAPQGISVPGATEFVGRQAQRCMT